MRKIHVANPGDRSWTRGSFVLAFGAYGDTYVLAYANHLEGALDECVDWIAEHAPGLLADDAVQEEYERALRALVMDGADPDDELTIQRAQESAEVNTTCAGNAGHYLNSWEWTIALDNPSKSTLIAFARGTL